MKADRIGLVIVLASLSAIAAIAYMVFQYQHRDRLADIRSQGVSLVRALSGVPYDQLVPGADHPDFLVTDIDMPRMSGKELCLAIQSQFPDRSFPIVVLTSRTELEHRDWTASIDNLTFMEKPVSVRRLLSHIDRRLTDVDQSVSA